MWPPRKIPGAAFSVRKMLRYIDSAAMMGEGYSGAGDWYAMGNYGRDGYRPDYRDGVSYRGRKRDSMGRYSRADAKEDMVDKLRRMIDEAPDSRTREALEKAVRCMED